MSLAPSWVRRRQLRAEREVERVFEMSPTLLGVAGFDGYLGSRRRARWPLRARQPTRGRDEDLDRAAGRADGCCLTARIVDTLSVAADGHIYYTVNQVHRQPLFQGGTDLRERPYAVMRTPIDGEPVRLRP